MSKVLIGHQPLFVGSVEWWSRIARADVFVIADHVDYEPKSAQSRHVLDGHSWVLPTVHAGRPLPIRETPIAWGDPKMRKLMRAVDQMWAGAPYRREARRLLRETLDHEQFEKGTLGFVTSGLMSAIWLYLELKSFPVTGDEINAEVKDPMLRGTILGQCLAAGADEYWCGISGKDYLPLAEFESHGVSVAEVGYDGRDGDLSILDLIARHGPKAREEIGKCVVTRWLVRSGSSVEA